MFHYHVYGKGRIHRRFAVSTSCHQEQMRMRTWVQGAETTISSSIIQNKKGEMTQECVRTTIHLQVVGEILINFKRKKITQNRFLAEKRHKIYCSNGETGY